LQKTTLEHCDSEEHEAYPNMLLEVYKHDLVKTDNEIFVI